MSLSTHAWRQCSCILELNERVPAAMLSQSSSRHLLSRKKVLTGLPSRKRISTVKTSRLFTLQYYSLAQGPDISLLSQVLQRQWDHDRNAHLGNIVITVKNGRKVWWTCDQCPDGHPHTWLAQVSKRSNGTGCPYCANRAVCQHNSLATKDPAVAAQWSHKNQLSPEEFMASSNEKAFWQCHCGFEWEASINHRTVLSNGCPACAIVKRRRKLVRHPVLTDSKHKMMQSWDWAANAKADLDPSKIRCCSHKKAHWICPKCPEGQPHRWQASVCDVYRGSGCPCCVGQQTCICNSLQSLWPHIAAQWDYSRNMGTPADYSARSNKKVWWHSTERGSFQATIGHRTRVKRPKPLQK